MTCASTSLKKASKSIDKGDVSVINRNVPFFWPFFIVFTIPNDIINFVSDLDFVQKCVKGDKLAWDEFLKRFSLLIYKYIHSVLISKNSSYSKLNAEDIFQEFISFLIQDDYKKLKSFKAKNGCSLATWLRQVVVNFTLSALRRTRGSLVSLDEENEEGSSLKDTLADNSFSIPELLNQEERLRSLEDCIEGLNNRDKLLIGLNINQGIKLGALKELFKISRGAIDMQKARLMERLRDCFRSKGFALDL